MPNLEYLSHWGSTVAPAGSEWYSQRNMYIQGNPLLTIIESILETRLAFGYYKDLIPLFTAVDPASWPRSLSKSGSSVSFPGFAEHHDGFQMYASTLSSYSQLEMGPRQRCLREELRKQKNRPALLYVLSPGQNTVFLFTWQGIH